MFAVWGKAAAWILTTIQVNWLYLLHWVQSAVWVKLLSPPLFMSIGCTFAVILSFCWVSICGMGELFAVRQSIFYAFAAWGPFSFVHLYHHHSSIFDVHLLHGWTFCTNWLHIGCMYLICCMDLHHHHLSQVAAHLLCGISFLCGCTFSTKYSVPTTIQVNWLNICCTRSNLLHESPPPS